MNNNLTIVGGGITGLAAAYIAAKNGLQVTILEKSNSFGGLLKTFPIGDNYLECYYHHFFTHDAELMWLLGELDLMDKLVYNNTSMGFFRHGYIYDFNTPFDLLRFKPLNIYNALKFGFTSLYLGKLANWEKYENISALKWFSKWAGRPATETVWRPMLNIKFGPHSSQIPLSWMIGRLRQRLKSREKGVEQLAYLDGSLKILLDALFFKLKQMNVIFVNKANIKELHVHNRKLIGISYNNESLFGGPFLFTIPTIKLLDLILPVDEEYAKRLAKIRYFGAICVVLELNRKFSDKYWLNIADEGYPFGGIIEHTNFISESQYSGKHIIYLSRYYDNSEPVASMKKEDIARSMITVLPKINRAFDKSWIISIHIFKTDSAAVVNDLGFSKKIMSCETPIDNLYIANMVHLYPDERSVNNSICVAANACRVIGLKVPLIPNSNSMAGKIGF